MKTLIAILQVFILSFIFWISSIITKSTHIPLPGSIVGLIILFALLQFKIVKIEWVERGASWLLAELILFFIPSAVGVINYQRLLGPQWGKLISVIVLSTLTVMVCTGLTAQYIAKRRKGDFHELPDKNS